MTRIGNSAVIGLQWGNEGKGPLLDFMTISSDVIVRYRGCSSSGRTINVGRNNIKVRYVPRGIAQSGKKCLISGGAFLDMEKMAAEISALKEAGALNAEFVISPHCHVVLDYHKKLARKTARPLRITEEIPEQVSSQPHGRPRQAREGRSKRDAKILAGARKQKQKTFSQVKIPVEILLYPREK